MNNPKPNNPPLRYLSPLHRIYRQIQNHLDRQARTLGVSGTEAHVLSYLGSYAPTPVGDLVRVFGLKKSTLTGLLDRLEKAELIVRALNPGDHRSLLIELTPQGATVAAGVRRQLEQFEAALDQALSPADQQALARLVAAVNCVTTRG